jgi:hypothetical protein
LGYEPLIKEFTLSPNPNSGKFRVIVNLSEATEIKLSVVQFPLGIIKIEYASHEASNHLVDFDLPDLPQGMYVLMLRVKNQDHQIRFIKN